jgi:hypothetical protein
MPATRVTLALNTKQTQKAPLLIPASAAADPATSSSICALVFKTAQSKLRLKKPSRVYVGGTGQELLSEKDWKSNIKNDVTLLVSAGEDFVGVKKESSTHGQCFNGPIMPQLTQPQQMRILIVPSKCLHPQHPSSRSL